MSAAVAGHIVTAGLSLLLLLGLFHGYREGLIKGAFKVAALVAGVLFAKPVAGALGPVVENLVGREVHWYLMVVCSFVLIVFAVSLAGALLSGFVHWTPLALLDKIGGAALGLLVAFALVGIFLNLLMSMDRLDPILDSASGWEGDFLRLLRSIVPDIFERGESLLDPIRDRLPKDMT